MDGGLIDGHCACREEVYSYSTNRKDADKSASIYGNTISRASQRAIRKEDNPFLFRQNFHRCRLHLKRDLYLYQYFQIQVRDHKTGSDRKMSIEHELHRRLFFLIAGKLNKYRHRSSRLILSPLTPAAQLLALKGMDYELQLKDAGFD
jgi:hypothetical protein